MNLPRPPRRHPRRAPGAHRPLRLAPETPAEVLERAPDVSRETPLGRYVAGGQVPDPVPPLRKDQVARLEALTAVWAREARDAGGYAPSPEDTMLYASAALPPPPPPRPREEAVPVDPPPAPAAVAEDQRCIHGRYRIDPCLGCGRRYEAGVLVGPFILTDETPAPVVSVSPAPPAPARRVSDWTSRHDPRSLAYAVRARLGAPVPLADVSLAAGPVLDQGTTPPLTARDASACVGMALTTAGTVLAFRDPRPNIRQDFPHREEFARELYALAQKFDHVHGEDYAGTSVLGGLLAGRELGLWDEFLWALNGTRDIAQTLLQLGVAVVVGVPWDAGLESPDPRGVIAPGGQPMGGHAVAVVGLKAIGGQWHFELQQSRGTAEGLGGRVFLHHRHLAQLLAGIGEAGVPLPRDL